MSIASRAGLAKNALSGRVALVTGAASGIGRATTRLLVGLGAVVVALGRDAATLSARCEAVPHADNRGLRHVVFDLADLINRGGENVYSIEVERVLSRHPGVAEVAVVGVLTR